MSDYPDGVYSPRTKANKDGVVYDAGETTKIFAEDIQKLDDEVVAIENELGINPKGEQENVTARLNKLRQLIAGIYNSGSRLCYTSNFGEDYAWGYSVPGGAAHWEVGSTYIRTSTTIGSVAYLEQKYNSYSYRPGGFEVHPAFGIVSCTTNSSNQEIYLLAGDHEYYGFGFHIVDGVVYAGIYTFDEVGDPVIDETEIEMTIDITKPHLFEASYDEDNNVRYYIDGELKATKEGGALEEADEGTYGPVVIWPYYSVKTTAAVSSYLHLKSMYYAYNIPTT